MWTSLFLSVLMDVHSAYAETSVIGIWDQLQIK